MRLPTVLALAPLISLVKADSMVYTDGCGAAGCSSSAVWRSPNSADHYFKPLAGCQTPESIPGMTTLCLDMANSRGHFSFDNGPKRCITKDESRAFGPCKSTEDCYWESTWEEGQCTW